MTDTRDPFVILAEHLGITPEEVGAMGRDDLARIRTATLAERDQAAAELRDLTNHDDQN